MRGSGVVDGGAVGNAVHEDARSGEFAVAERAAGAARRTAREHRAPSARTVQGFSPSRSTRDWVVFISQNVTSPFLCERPADEPSSYFSS
ncbi:hypothetical protein SMA5143A_7806 [Streptomyces sp. MA5143a]|nr:hypothetical protein SMA5143A_7806 [Streptomyces sp. MA5143a]